MKVPTAVITTDEDESRVVEVPLDEVKEIPLGLAMDGVTKNPQSWLFGPRPPPPPALPDNPGKMVKISK